MVAKMVGLVSKIIVIISLNKKQIGIQVDITVLLSMLT